jgi:hypothetical protein
MMSQYQDVSWVVGKLRHKYNLCPATDNMTLMLSDDPRIDTPENTAKKRPCKNCIKALKADEKYFRERVEVLQRNADAIKVEATEFMEEKS